MPAAAIRRFATLGSQCRKRNSSRFTPACLLLPLESLLPVGSQHRQEDIAKQTPCVCRQGDPCFFLAASAHQKNQTNTTVCLLPSEESQYSLTEKEKEQLHHHAPLAIEEASVYLHESGETWTLPGNLGPIPLHCGGTTNMGSVWDPTTGLLGGTQDNVKMKEKSKLRLHSTHNKSRRYSHRIKWKSHT